MLEDIIKEIDQFIADSSDLCDRHNAIKNKWLWIWTYELFQRIEILETASNMAVSWKSLYTEDKQALEVIKWKRRIELKSEVDDKGKKKHTESTAEAVINEEFADEDKALLTLKTAYELLLNICKVIPEYVNVVKMDMKALNPLQWMPWD
jgi:hypothetical protein